MPDLKIKADADNVVVRMYNIGFGDCFLLLIPTPEGTKKVLVDCGVHQSGHNKDSPLNAVIAQLMIDVTEDGVPHIDIIIVTHRHQDHVVGFEKDVWENVQVGEVWMPWTENYDDKDAVRILNLQSKSAVRVKKTLDMMINKAVSFGFGADKVTELKALLEFAENSLTNKKAMHTLHNGFKGGKDIKRRYLPFVEPELNRHRSKLLPGVTVHLIGPSRKDSIIADMEPIKAEQWFRLMEDIGTDELKTHRPFHADWSRDYTPADLATYADTAKDREKLAGLFADIANINYGTEFGVATSVEGAVNGTSLMFMIEVGKAFLFFPGDAQNGTWKMALGDEEWRNLLMKTNFYKIGHHGSHNSTPKEFVFDILPAKAVENGIAISKFKAMASVYPVKTFSKIPKVELVTELLAKSDDVVRSDQPFDNHADTASFQRQTNFVETKVQI